MMVKNEYAVIHTSEGSTESFVGTADTLEASRALADDSRSVTPAHLYETARAADGAGAPGCTAPPDWYIRDADAYEWAGDDGDYAIVRRSDCDPDWDSRGRYEISEDSGASKIIRADSLAEALEDAKDWSADGDYLERVMVTVDVEVLEPADDTNEEIGDHECAEVAAGPEPKEPDCARGHGHEWRSPKFLGGCDSNPGVWSTGGTSLAVNEVCIHCGTYRHTACTGSQRNPGELPETVSYEDADARSRGWVLALIKEHLQEIVGDVGNQQTPENIEALVRDALDDHPCADRDDIDELIDELVEQADLV
jgi:hypothetical protein